MTAQSPPSPPAPLLGKYTFHSLLGRGTSASVYLGHTVSTNEAVAIKVINKSSLTPATSAYVLREVTIMRRLSHPNILRLREVLATKSKIYLIMDYAAGGDLISYLRRGSLPERIVHRLFSQLVSALHFCHSHGVSHRDIKPQNLLLDASGNLLVADFGLSALAEHRNGDPLRTRCGTPTFLAPEVLHTKGYDGAKADAWSCGVLLYVLLTGSLPFGNDDNINLYYQRAKRMDLSFPEGFPRRMRGLVSRLLDPYPNTRKGIAELAKIPWIQKAMTRTRPTPKVEEEQRMETPNAFEIIRTASGLDLSGMFEEGEGKEELRFTTTGTAVEVERKVVDMGKEKGCSARKGKLGVWELWSIVGMVAMRVEVVELCEGLRMGVVAVERAEFGLEEVKKAMGTLVRDWF